MNRLVSTHNDKLDLHDFFKMLWDEKIKIIASAVIFGLISFIFNYDTPNSFKISFPIESGKSSVFYDYIPIKDILRNNGLLKTEENKSGFMIDEQSIFYKFISEFNDSQELIESLNNNEFISQRIKALDDHDKNEKLISYAKSLEITPPTPIERNWIVSFEWHDSGDGLNLLKEAITNSLLNLQAQLLIDIEKMSQFIDIRNKQELDKLNVKLNLIQEMQGKTMRKHIQFLSEQSAIAKELNIETNKLDINALSKNQVSGVSLNISSDEIPFYLRGYKAIDKEISLILSRSKETQLMMAEDYIDTKSKIFVIENSLAASQLRTFIETLRNDDPNEWIEYNIAFADIKSQKKTKLYITLSVILGVIVGIIYALISMMNRNRRNQLVSTN
tara:strand:+ start:2635 stop:3798 length:1164 start_codon:yes stop_codon:yes gene_type:complete